MSLQAVSGENYPELSRSVNWNKSFSNLQHLTMQK